MPMEIAPIEREFLRAGLPSVAVVPRSLGMGEAYRASGAGNGAIYTNPAGISRLTMYSAEWMWLRLPDGSDVFHVSAVDTKTQDFGAGLGYSWTPDDTDEHDLRLALSYSAVPERLFVGSTMRYVFLDRPEGTANEHVVAFDVGLAAHLGAGFFLGAVAHNLIDDDALADASDRHFGFGASWEGAATISADVLLDPARSGGDMLTYQAGGELLVAEQVPVRAGWTFSPATAAHTFSVGGGVMTPTGALEAAYRQRVDGGPEERTFSLSMKLFL